MIRSRDTHTGYNARLPAPAFLSTEPGRGTGHVSPGMNTRFCAPCACNRPSKGGKYRGPLFICSLHQKASVPA